MDIDKQRALLDHEVAHLELVRDDAGKVKTDDAGRPRLRIRPHDYQTGGFWDVIERHKEAACEAVCLGLRDEVAALNDELKILREAKQ